MAEINFLTVLEAKSPRSTCRQVLFLLRPLLGLQMASFLLCPHMVFLLCIHTPVAFILFIYLFKFYFIFGCVGSSLPRAGFSLFVESGGYSLLRCAGFSLRWLLLLQSTGSRRAGFSSCGAWASVVVARGLSSCGARA